MKRKLSRFSKRYHAALLAQLGRSAPLEVVTALEVGSAAVLLGLETLDLARIHERSLFVLGLSDRKNIITKRAECFFSESIAPIVATHSAARQDRVRINRLRAELKCRTCELAAASRLLRQGITRRKKMEESLKKSAAHNAGLLGNSVLLQNYLRKITHRAIAAQENERRKLSGKLQNGLAQALIGVTIGLHSLKNEEENNGKGYRNSIAITQKLALNAAQAIRNSSRGTRRP